MFIVLFLGIISFKGISCFNGRVVFFRWGGSFLSEEGVPCGGGHQFWWGVFEKIVGWGGGCTCPPYRGKPWKGGNLRKGGRVGWPRKGGYDPPYQLCFVSLLNGNVKWQVMCTYHNLCSKPFAHAFSCQSSCCWIKLIKS